MAKHGGDPHIVVVLVVVFVWSFDQKEVGVLAAVTFLADVQRNLAAVIAAAENIDTDVGILFFEFGMSFRDMWKLMPERLRVFR